MYSYRPLQQTASKFFPEDPKELLWAVTPPFLTMVRRRAGPTKVLAGVWIGAMVRTRQLSL